MTFYKKTDKFGFRKSKVCRSLCGALLGTVAVVSLATASTEIHADEATTTPPTINEKTVEIPNLAQDTKKVAPKVTVTPEVVNQPKQLPKYE